jgi:peptidoglycan/LPS O-acetylase OafA/YrhL
VVARPEINEPVTAPAAPTSAPPELRPLGRVAALDAVRDIAIGLVICRHTVPSLFGAGGIVGVEVFFALSGYLITSILAREQALNRFSFARFYRNRFLRLAPALIVMVAVIAVTEWARGDESHASVAGGTAVALFYLADFTTAFALPAIPQLSHLWTLAVEEQFYLVWPAAFALLVHSRNGAQRGTLRALSLGAVALVATASILNRPEPTYSLPTTWAIALLIGAAMAVGCFSLPAGPGEGWAAAAALGAMAFLPDAKEALWAYLAVVPLAGLSAAVLISNAAGNRPAWFLRSRWLQWLGLISYAAYLWNGPLTAYIGIKFSVFLTLLVAFLSYRLVERPFLAMKRHAATGSDQHGAADQHQTAAEPVAGRP